jgi:putative pyruvate formate lyase activating enzyme
LSELERRGEDELWKAHARGMETFRSAWRDGVAPDVAEPSLLDVKLELASRMLEDCRCCERRCGADRANGSTGFCGVGRVSRYSSQFLHMGEEPELVPSHTIFFSGCTFACAYCQNWEIAMHPEAGLTADPRELASLLEEGIGQGSRNANFVGGNPDPHLHTILAIVAALGERADRFPLVWNSNMYTSREAMQLLEGVMDVWLGDFRYGNDQCASRLSGVEGYFAVVSRNFLAAYEAGEVMLRHLVLPGHLECCTLPIMRWVKRHMPDVYFNLMFQYRPEYRASLHPEINRRLTPEERREALDYAGESGLNFAT